MKISEYERGYQDALRVAITWLHAEANRMGDPKARNILNSAAFGLGSEYSNETAKARIANRARSEFGKPDRAE